MNRAVLAECFKQLLDGYDIPKPESVLKVSQDSANRKLPHLPYSLATNLSHAVVWQDFWLQKLAGGRQKSGMQEWQNDFKVPDESQFAANRAKFLAGLTRARDLASSEPFEHSLNSDEEAVETLVRILIHAAYHLGQMNLLKRAAKLQSNV